MYSLPHVMGTYLNRTLDSYGEERTTLSQQIEAKTDRLKKVEDKLKTDKEKYRAQIEAKKDRLKKVETKLKTEKVKYCALNTSLQEQRNNDQQRRGFFS